MKRPNTAFSVEAAKGRQYCQTSVLDPYKDALLSPLREDEVSGKRRASYKVIKGELIFVFKHLTCYETDKELIRQLEEEFYLSVKAYNAASDGVVAPISFEQMNDEMVSKHVIEMIYEHAGESLLSALENAEGSKVVEAMKTVVRTMSRLTRYNIFHLAIRPENIAISNEVVKMFNFGVTLEYDDKTGNLSIKAKMDKMNLYLPPEVITNKKGAPGPIDVYGWGMTLFHLLLGVTSEEFENLVENRVSNYTAFIDHIKKLKLKDDKTGVLTKKMIDILQKVLSFKPEDRPTFEKLEAMLFDEKLYKDEINGLKAFLTATSNERGNLILIVDEIKKKYDALLIEHNSK